MRRRTGDGSAGTSAKVNLSPRADAMRALRARLVQRDRIRRSRTRLPRRSGDDVQMTPRSSRWGRGGEREGRRPGGTSLRERDLRSCANPSAARNGVGHGQACRRDRSFAPSCGLPCAPGARLDEDLSRGWRVGCPNTHCALLGRRILVEAAVDAAVARRTYRRARVANERRGVASKRTSRSQRQPSAFRATAADPTIAAGFDSVGRETEVTSCKVQHVAGILLLDVRGLPSGTIIRSVGD